MVGDVVLVMVVAVVEGRMWRHRRTARGKMCPL